jgi:hypothetical protein
VTSDKVDLLMGPLRHGAILSAMGVAQRYNKVLVHHTFGIPSLAKYEMQFPAWALGPDPGQTVPNTVFDMLAASKQAAEDHRRRHQQVSLGALHVAGRREVAKKRGLKEVLFLGMGLRQPRLRPDRRARQGRQAGPGVDGRHRARRQYAARRDEEDRLRAAAALPSLSRAGPNDQLAGRRPARWR